MKASLKEGFIIGPRLHRVWPHQVIAQQHLGGVPLRRRKSGKKRREGRKGKGREEGRDPEPPFEREAKRRDLSIGSSLWWP